MPKTRKECLPVAAVVVLAMVGYTLLFGYRGRGAELLAAEGETAPPAPPAEGPEVDRPERSAWAVREDLGAAAAAWVRKPDAVTKAKVEEMVALVVGMKDGDAETLFLAAKVADLCGDPAKAVSILETIIDRHGGEVGPRPVAPTATIAQTWIGYIASHSGDVARATKAFEEVTKASAGDPKTSGLALQAQLNLAEIALEQLKDKELTLARLDKAAAIAASMPGAPGGGEDKKLATELIDYQRAAIKEGARQAGRRLRCEDPRKRLGAAGMMSMLTGEGALTWADFRGSECMTLFSASLQQVIQNHKSPLNRHLARIALAVSHEHEAYHWEREDPARHERELSEAVAQLSALLEEDCFFSPIAGLQLGHLKEAKGKKDEANAVLEKVRTMYPGYGPAVDEVKKSWEKQSATEGAPPR
jgi:tetratricopeptide (TPR) repeat protein